MFLIHETNTANFGTMCRNEILAVRIDNLRTHAIFGLGSAYENIISISIRYRYIP